MVLVRTSIAVVGCLITPGLLVLGCDGGTGLPPEARTPDAGAPSTIAAPLPLEPPRLEPCPAGWRVISGADGTQTCEPWPDAIHDSACAQAEAHFPGTPGCASVGTDCPADGWPADLPADRPLVYVDDDAAPGGDGSSRASPLSSIDAATSIAPVDAIVAVATGTYDGYVRVWAGQTVWGACPSETVLTASEPSTMSGVVSLREPRAGARNLSIVSPERHGVVMRSDATSLEQVAIVAAHSTGIIVSEGTARVVRCAVRNTLPDSGGVFPGPGIQVQGGARLEIAGGVIEGNAADALVVVNGSTIVANDVAAGWSAAQGAALVVADARAELANVVLEAAVGTALIGRGPAATVEGDHVIVRATRAIDPATPSGAGVFADAGAVIALSRTAVDGNRAGGVVARGTGTIVRLTDSVVRSTLPAAGNRGYGAVVGPGAELAATRCVFAANHAVGVLVDAGTLIASDVLVRGTMPDAAGDAGFGLEVQGDSLATLDRVLLDSNETAGLLGTRGARIDARDLVVRATQARTRDGHLGVGIQLESAARLVPLERARLEGNRDIALVVAGGSVVEGTDVVVSGTLPRLVDDSWGLALIAGDAATRATFVRTRFEASSMAGVVALLGATISLREVEVRGVATAPCATSTCADYSGGHALVARLGGRLDVSDFVLADAALCGVVVGEDSADGTATSVDLMRGVITNVPIGACVQVDSFDTRRLQTDVEYRDVGVPLRATSYQLPDRPL